MTTSRPPPSHARASVDVNQLRNDNSGPVLTTLGEQIMEAAFAHQFDPVTVPRGQIAARDMSDPQTGQRVTGFIGQESFIKSMSRPPRKLRRLIATDSRTGVRTVLVGPPEDRLN